MRHADYRITKTENGWIVTRYSFHTDSGPMWVFNTSRELAGFISEFDVKEPESRNDRR
jgi:hypothetical protein